MTEVLFEKPLILWIISGLSVAILLSGFMKTGQLKLLFAAGAALLVGLGLILLERVVVTERERIERTLYEMADALKRDDVPRLLSSISASAPSVQAQARANLKAYVVREASIKRNLTIQLQPADAPVRATVTFNAVLIGGDRGGIVDQQRIAMFFTLQMVKEGDAWRVVDYKFEDFREGLGALDQLHFQDRISSSTLCRVMS